MFFIHNFVFFLFGRFSKNLSILTSEIFLTFLTPLTFLTCLQAVLNRSSDAEHIPNADVNKIQILKSLLSRMKIKAQLFDISFFRRKLGKGTKIFDNNDLSRPPPPVLSNEHKLCDIFK